MNEATLVDDGSGLAPEDEGWFVLNAKDARWRDNPDFGRGARFEGTGAASFKELGVNIRVLQPGHPLCKYHAENAQEDFLILAGTGTLIVEGEERPLRRWDVVHCPGRTKHVLVATADEPLVVLAIGARPEREELLYPVDETALKHGAGVEMETTDGDVAYASSATSSPTRYVEGDLPA